MAVASLRKARPPILITSIAYCLGRLLVFSFDPRCPRPRDAIEIASLGARGFR